jgi:hypothetical protein
VWYNQVYSWNTLADATFFHPGGIDATSHIDPDHEELSMWDRPDVLLVTEDACRLEKYLHVRWRITKVQQAAQPTQYDSPKSKGLNAL